MVHRLAIWILRLCGWRYHRDLDFVQGDWRGQQYLYDKRFGMMAYPVGK